MNILPSIAEAARGIRAGKFHPRELVECCLRRIEMLEERVRAWVRVDEQGARRAAERLGKMARQGELLGPLHGIPVGIKDIVDVAGWPTEAGSPLLRGSVANQDAAVVRRLRASGAILLGKTATTEFAYLDPAPTRNPWRLEHTPGGSSSGSAAAVAAGMCMAAVGSQTGGSIIRPASFCGVAGLKPTFGRVDIAGVVPVSRHLDHVGPIARTAGDLWLAYCAMIEMPGAVVPIEPPARPPVLHVIDDAVLPRADPAIRDAVPAAYAKLRSAGADLRPLALPSSFQEVWRMHGRIMAVDAAEVHRGRFARHRDAYGPRISELIEEGLAHSAVEYASALRHLEAFRETMRTAFGEATIAAMPATVTPAPPGLGSTGDPAFNVPWSYAGLPAVTVPCGLSPDGLPVGLQLIGPPDGEARLLAAATWCEQVLAFQSTPPRLQP